MNTTKPAVISKSVEIFCRKIVREFKLIDVPVAPTQGASLDNCFPNVLHHIDKCGGSIVYGWAIWECDPYFLEAEFHAVWQSPDGILIDITPKREGESNILFLPDSSRKWSGARTKNERFPLQPTPLVKRFIELADARDIQASHCDKLPSEANLRKWMHLDKCKNMALSLIAWNGNLNSNCPCGSGDKFKHCHGKR